MQKPWSIYNKVEKLRVDDLKPEQVKLILLTIPTAKMGDWYACQEGDIHWQPMSAIPDFYEDVRMLKGGSSEQAAPEVKNTNSPRRPLFEDAPDEHALKTDPALIIDLKETKERRSARRYNRNLIFKVIDGGKSFQSETSDISMSGVSLKDQLPEWVPKKFKAVLSSNKNNIQITCSRVDNNKLKLIDSESWDVIRQWLVNW